jgi:MFS family permease
MTRETDVAASRPRRAPTAVAAPARGLVALRHRPFRRFWMGQLVAAVGVSMQSVSLPWLVLTLGGSGLDVGLTVALQYAPVPVLAPVSGAVADRVDKRRLLLALHATAMATAAGLFALTVLDVVSIPYLFAFAAVLGVLNGLEMPVRQSFLAELVPPSALRSAIAMTMSGFNAARMVGPAIAGIVIASVGVAATFALNAVGSIALLTGLAGIRVRFREPGPADGTAPGIWSALREGLDYARRTPQVRWPLALLGGLAVLGMNFQVLLPLLARDVLGLDGSGYGLLFAALGLGSLVGSIAVALLRPRSWRPLMIGGAAAMLACEAMLALAGALAPAVLLVSGMGGAAMLMVSAVNVTLQEHVTDELRGRVMSLYVVVFAGSVPAGGLFAGAVAERWGPSAGLLVGAAASSVVLVAVSRPLARAA